MCGFDRRRRRLPRIDVLPRRTRAFSFQAERHHHPPHGAARARRPAAGYRTRSDEEIQMHRIARRTALALAVAGTTACNGGHVTTGPERLAGTYTLQTVNSAALPFTLSTSGSQSVRLTAGSVTLTSASSFVVRETTQTLNNGAVVSTAADSLTGNYFVTGDNVTLDVTSPATAQYTGTVLNSVLTLDVNTNLYRYAR
jgi:hypothetical protein